QLTKLCNAGSNPVTNANFRGMPFGDVCRCDTQNLCRDQQSRRPNGRFRPLPHDSVGYFQVANVHAPAGNGYDCASDKEIWMPREFRTPQTLLIVLSWYRRTPH